MARNNGRAARASETNGALEYRVSVKDLPLSDRPRERLEHSGPRALSDAELLAIILRTGTNGCDVRELSSKLLMENGLAGVDRAELSELRRFRGLGRVKSVEIKAAIELGKRLVSLHPEQRARVASPLDIYNLVRAEMTGLDQEELRVLLLNTKNQVMASHQLYRGSLNTTSVRLGELFKRAVRENAAAIALVHNHPSGDPTPSPEDVALTRDAVQAGSLLDIEVLDHVVVGDAVHRFVSLKERGLGFSAPAR